MKPSEILQSSSSYWDSKVEDFDAIYSGKNWSKAYKLISDILRKDIFDRVEESVNIANRYQQPISILDIGCGTGRLIEALQPTQHFIVGVDYSQQMLEKAKHNFSSYPVPESSYQLICGDMVNDWPIELNRYDGFKLVYLLGLVEYISDPVPLLQKILKVSPEQVIVTFCRANTIRSYLRQARYKIQGLDCPLFFYSQNEIRQFGEQLGAQSTEIKIMGQLFFTVYRF